MFATDYPHWHYDDPSDALPPALGATFRAKVLATTARTFYRLEDR